MSVRATQDLSTGIRKQDGCDERGEMSSKGRLLRMGAANGSTNMGIDEALATRRPEGAILRFYAWEAPTLSIGYAQRSRDINLAACRTSMVRVVRRPTGGRAVLHRQDLTYSLILPLRPPWTTISITESYRLINRCLRRGLEMLGLEVHLARRLRQAERPLSLFCFPAISAHDLLIGGKKVIGSAQRRFPASLLQQGSIVLEFDPTGILDLLCSGERAMAVDALKTVGSLRDALGRLPGRQDVETVIREGFAAEMGIEFIEDALKPEELALSMELAATRYSSEDWTFRR
ncbi:Octanoyltransferase LipM [Candidatus Methylomirabilis lanthanidiphila]|uniref:Octanoyltransferase LipM n=1 Tax=Candidatus Methylomirabilis lanthanidiphila TaxID=2211376 RepID=A0A564ZF21_9BACT|nr:Octanoyltransferase LipM [Candidatus Methylomirabilis lanthanidiphila]